MSLTSPGVLLTAFLCVMSLAMAACGNTGTQADPASTTDVPTRTPEPTVVPTPDPTATAVPVVSEATLPTLTLTHEGRTIDARRFEGCWRPDASSDLQCVGTSPRGELGNYLEVESGDVIEVRITPDSLPSRLLATFFAQPGEIGVGDLLWLSPAERRLVIDMPPGRYNVRLHAQWFEGQRDIQHKVNYVFGIEIPGETALESSCVSTAAGGILGILLESLGDPYRTALDAVNSGGCTFNSRIASVVLVLENDDRRYVETFRLEPPSLKVGLPLPEGTVSETTGGPLPAGLYSRLVVAVTVDGITKMIADRAVKLSDGPADPDAAIVFLHHHEAHSTSSPEEIDGTLQVRNGCVYIRNGEIPVWPSSFSVREQDGRVEILNGQGGVEAREDHHVFLRGRMVAAMEPPGRELTRATPLSCPPGDFWIVDAPPDTGGQSLFPDAMSSPDWTPAEVSNPNSSEGFTVMLPPGWELRELQGIDSLVGEIVGDGVRLVYDYGNYSSNLDPANFDQDGAYTVVHEVVGGMEAKIVVPTFGTGALTGVYIGSLGGLRFNLVGEDLTLEQQRPAVTIFRSIRVLNR